MSPNFSARRRKRRKQALDRNYRKRKSRGLWTGEGGERNYNPTLSILEEEEERVSLTGR